MVEFIELAADYKAVNESERYDRDKVVLEMIKFIVTKILDGTLQNTLHIEISFFSYFALEECIEYLQTSGVWSLCHHEMDCTRVINLWIDPKKFPLFRG